MVGICFAGVVSITLLQRHEGTAGHCRTILLPPPVADWPSTQPARGPTEHHEPHEDKHRRDFPARTKADGQRSNPKDRSSVDNISTAALGTICVVETDT